jgi:hypothetical protein
MAKEVPVGIGQQAILQARFALDLTVPDEGILRPLDHWPWIFSIVVFDF